MKEITEEMVSCLTERYIVNLVSAVFFFSQFLYHFNSTAHDYSTNPQALDGFQRLL